MIALRIVALSDKGDFDAWDASTQTERAACAKLEREKLRAREESGPNGETEETHDVQVDVQKCGGKGQTQRVRTWLKRMPDELDGAASTL